MKVPFLSHTRSGRYDRQEPLIGRSGQKRLGKCKATIIGLGSIGCTVAQAVVRSGVGNVTLIDRDIVESENLHTQFLYSEKDIDRPKSEMSRKRLVHINPDIKITPRTLDLTPENIEDAIGNKDLVIDCTDNLATRFLLNDYCRKRKIPWVHTNAIRYVGTAALFLHDKDSPCFTCIYGEKSGEETCETAGVMNTTTAAVGAIAAHLAIQHLLGKQAVKEMLRIDLEAYQVTRYALKRSETCPVCTEKRFIHLDERRPATVKLCGASMYQITGKRKDLRKLKERLERHGRVDDFTTCLKFKELTIFDDGRVLIRTSSKEEAQVLYNKYVSP